MVEFKKEDGLIIKVNQEPANINAAKRAGWTLVKEKKHYKNDGKKYEEKEIKKVS